MFCNRGGFPVVYFFWLFSSWSIFAIIYANTAVEDLKSDQLAREPVEKKVGFSVGFIDWLDSTTNVILMNQAKQ